MELYLDSGYLNVPWINKVANNNQCPFIVIIGKRQVGKTYGVLQYVVQEKEPFILMRRSTIELDFISKNENSPFAKIQGCKHIEIDKNSKYTADIIAHYGEGDENIGLALALATIANIRGFNGDRYKRVVFDEFIPESHVWKIRNEGDAFLNAYVTISGNRELEGCEPLQCWLLANSNDLSSPILSALKITDDIANMVKQGQEIKILRERGILIIYPKSELIIDQRKTTALYRAVGTDSDFANMSINAGFNNDTHDIGIVDLTNYIMVSAYHINNVVIYCYMNGDRLFYTTHYYPRCGKIIEEFNVGFDAEVRRNMRIFPNMKSAILRGYAIYSSYEVKKVIFDFYGIKL